MKYLLYSCIVLAFTGSASAAEKKEEELNTEIIYRSPLRDVVDDGKDLKLDSKEKVGLAARMATIEEKLTSFEKLMLDLLEQVKKNNGRLDGIEDKLTEVEAEIARLKEQQAATRVALQEADKQMTEMETRVSSMEKHVEQVKQWANQVWQQAQSVHAQAQQALAYAQQADAAARPSGIIGGLLSLIPGLGHQ